MVSDEILFDIWQQNWYYVCVSVIQGKSEDFVSSVYLES